jgi:Glycosyltransferase family 87
MVKAASVSKIAVIADDGADDTDELRIAPPATTRKPSPLLKILTGMSITVVAIQVVIWFQNIASGHDRDTDFGAFYTGYRMVHTGLGQQLYDFAQQKIMQKAILHGGSYEVGLLPFVNPPHVAMIGSPLASLSMRAAYFTMAAVNVLLLGVLLRLLWALTPSLRKDDRLRVMLFALSFPPLLIAFMQGSWSLVLAVGMALFALAWREDSLPLMMLASVALSTKPQYVVLPFVALVVARRWRLIAGAALGGLAIAATTSVVLGPRIWIDYLKQLGSYSANGNKYGINAQAMVNVRGLFVRLFGEVGSDATAKIGLALGISLTVFMWSRTAVTTARITAVLPNALIATILLASITSFHAHAQDTVVFAVAAAIAAETLVRTHRFSYAHRVALATACFPLLIAINQLTGTAGTIAVIAIGGLATVVARWDLQVAMQPSAGFAE